MAQGRITSYYMATIKHPMGGMKCFNKNYEADTLEAQADGAGGTVPSPEAGVLVSGGATVVAAAVLGSAWGVARHSC